METRVSGEVLLTGRAPSYSVPGACSVVIFGASGDLTTRKLMPALYALAEQKLLPRCFSIVGVARTDMGQDGFRRRMREAVEKFSRLGSVRDDVWMPLAQTMHYLSASVDDPTGIRRLRDVLARVDQTCGTEGNRLFYLATPPTAYAGIVRALGEAGLAAPETGWGRIIIEKPFGRDLMSARELNRQVLEVFREPQIYRIDHYLGKETIQNILAFRFGNSIFEPLWNRRYVDHVQITASETVGVESRGGYYEKAGVLRDMFQNHLLQLFCLTAMEPPAAFAADAIRDEKVKVLRSVKPISLEAVEQIAVRGQYGRGTVGEGEVRAYREEEGVVEDSTTETYAALKLFVDNWRWQGVPFYLRSGKRMARRVTEVAIQFKQPPLLLFKSCALEQFSPNTLVLRIQPDEGISLGFEVKPPGPEICVSPLSLDFSYKAAFGESPPDAYETLLLDCMRGDSTLFIRHDWIELAWALLTPVLEAWEATLPQGFPNYQAGTWGPEEADALMARDGRQWRRP